jgi:cardiolipin synthase
MAQNHAEVLVDGHRLLPVLLQDIRAARREINVSVFLFFRDPIGLEVAAALEERARAGVTVRVLLNLQKTGMGDPFSTGEKQMIEEDPGVDYDPLDVKPLCEELERAGVSVVDTNIDYDADVAPADPRLRSVAAQIRDSIDIDDLHIDHRKIVVIDGYIAYSGGANIGAQYLHHVAFDPAVDSREEGRQRRERGQSEPWWKWHDGLTRFEGRIATEVNEEFRSRWILDGGEPFEVQSAADQRAAPRGLPIASARVYTNAPDGTPNAIRALYVRLIEESKESVFIENPYLYHPAIVDALCGAKRANPRLDIELILPGPEYNDNAFAADAQQHCYVRYLEAGIDVHEYQNHFTHLKMAVFDARFSIHGSTNLNYRSLEDDKDFELVVLVDDAPLAGRILREVRDEDRRCSRRVGADDVHGLTLTALRTRIRDPRTLFLISQRGL